MNRVPNDRNRLLVPCSLDPPKPKCYVCAPKPELTVVLNTSRFKVGMLQEKARRYHFKSVPLSKSLTISHICFSRLFYLSCVCYINMANVPEPTFLQVIQYILYFHLLHGINHCLWLKGKINVSLKLCKQNLKYQ